jgi:L,D-transpeptidase ErfK/SrfK
MKTTCTLVCFVLLLAACGKVPQKNNQLPANGNTQQVDNANNKDLTGEPSPPDSILTWVNVEKDIRVKDYFHYMDHLVKQVDTFANWHNNEYTLVHANPWIIDSLRSFDYYTMMDKGIFVYDQTQLIILHQGDRLAVPDSGYAKKINDRLASTIIDVNIPEFKLRLIQLNDTILTCNVRAGRDGEKFIYVVGHVINLRTPVGTGKIEWIDRMHITINLDNGKEYPGTNRDDGKFTKMPIIPWIEPRINGVRYGVMIHPTTNPKTLGKAYSHGCVGTTEADAWTIYYNSPIGTRVIFRYDLQVIDEKGDTLLLEDVYHRKK